ncbi:MAG: thioredoxin [Deltaproteobacteria bacterium]|nr:thioredoxin [Deltaproteobacteria bacterium]
MATELVHFVNDQTFNEVVLKSPIPVLVDFWAPWCGPCKAIAPLIDKIAEENDGKVLVCKVNVDESAETAAKYGIRGIPTIILFKNGSVINQVTGAVPKSQLDAMIA